MASAWLQKERSGSWTVRWREPAGGRGAKTFRRWTDARSFRNVKQTELERDDYVPDAKRRAPLGEYLGRILDASDHLEASTVTRQRTALQLVLRAKLGGLSLSRVTADDVREFFAGLDNPSASNKAMLRRLLSKAFRKAVAEGLMTRNPLATIEAPKYSGRKVRPPTPDQIETLVAAVPDRWRVPILLGAYAGLRIGEVGRLRIEHLNPPARTLRVEDSKTSYSQATLRISEGLAADIAAHMLRYPPVDGVVFTSERGTPVNRMSADKLLKRVGPRVGLPGFRFHDLRHAHASMLISRNLHPKKVQERMRHSSIKITMDTYGHLYGEMDDEAVDLLEEVRAEARKGGEVVAL